MNDKTALEISDELRHYIEALVEEVVFHGRPFKDQKKYLRRFCDAENVDYGQLEKNLSILLEAIEELKNHESKSAERLVKLLTQEYYLSSDKITSMISVINEKRAAGKIGLKFEEKAAKAQYREDVNILILIIIGVITFFEVSMAKWWSIPLIIANIFLWTIADKGSNGINYISIFVMIIPLIGLSFLHFHWWCLFYLLIPLFFAKDIKKSSFYEQ